MLTIGERVGSYQVVRAIGSGGMGMVFEAVHERIRSRAAIKILHAQYSSNLEVRERFLTEALATNLVQHPGIVSIFEHGQTSAEAAYIIMEYLEGESLRARIDALIGTRTVAPTPRGVAPLDRAAALRLLRQLASAMAAAHEKGIVHRDLKPENIMIVKDPFTLGGERVKVLDFGIAKVLGPDGPRGRTGGLLGTPAYMAPEAWEGAATVNEKVDVYALGIILFEALTGTLPVEDAKSNVVRWQELHTTVAPLALRSVDPSISEALDALCLRMLSKNPQERPTMSIVASELEQLVGLNLRFRAGGFVRDGEFYARRAADAELFAALLSGQSCSVLGPRQSGKTSLMHATIQRLSNVRGPALERGVLCAVLDLRSVESSGARGERFYFELWRELHRGLGLLGVPTDLWTQMQQKAPRPAERLAQLLRELPAQLHQPAILFIDHLEVLLRLPLPAEEFFTALAALPSSSSQPLAFCVLGTALPQDLTLDGRRGSILPSKTLWLGDLNKNEVRVFLPGLHALGVASEKVLTAVFSWTAGHPFLTQRMCEALSTKPLLDGSIQHLVDSAAAEVISSNRRREDASFVYAEEGLRRAGALRPTLLALYRQILEEKLPAAADSAALLRLELLGMIRKKDSAWQVRNRIFAAVFSADWLAGEEAVRPLQSPLAQWQANRRDSEYLLSGSQLRAALAWARNRQDLNADEQAFISASIEQEEGRQRRRIVVLLSVVLLLLTSLVGAGLAFGKLRLAKLAVEAQEQRTAAALTQAQRARVEADNARQKTLLALRAADEARRTAEEARVETETALGEAARQRGVALYADQRAKLARDRAQQAAHIAQQASQSAQEANQSADEAKKSAGRALSEKAEAIAAIEERLAQCEKDQRTSGAAAQRCQQNLDAKEAETQSLRGSIGSQNAQLASINSQLANTNAQLAACRASEPGRLGSGSAAPAEPSGPSGPNVPASPAVPSESKPEKPEG